jgi:hypothetical protein
MHYYALQEVALQGSIATLTYVLVTLTNNRCKLATDIDGYSNPYLCLYKLQPNGFYSSLLRIVWIVATLT